MRSRLDGKSHHLRPIYLTSQSTFLHMNHGVTLAINCCVYRVLLYLEFASKVIPHLQISFLSSLAIAPGPPRMSTRYAFCGGLECDHQLNINIHAKCVCKCCYKSITCQNKKITTIKSSFHVILH